MSYMRSSDGVRLDTVPASLNPSDVGYDIILAIGQSNMAGRGAAYDALRFDPTSAQVWQYPRVGAFANQIVLASEPLAYPDIAAGMGPALVFARWYTQVMARNRRALIVPAAYGGTGFESDAGSGFRWKIGTTPSGNNLYTQAVTQTQNALTAAGSHSRIVAVLWCQGETDGDNNVTGPTYQADLLAMIDQLRTDLSIPTVPFLMLGMVPEYLSTGSRTAIDAVHQAIPGLRSGVAFAFGAPGRNNGDGNHYNASGQRLNGQQLFTAYQAVKSGATGSGLIIAAPPSPSSPVPGQVGGLSQTGTQPTTLTIAWSAVSGATFYLVERAAHGSGTWTSLGTVTTLNFTDTGLVANTTYDYRVTAGNGTGTGAVSAVLAASTGSPIAPGQVTSLASSGNYVGATSVGVTWAQPSSGTTPFTYIVEYKKTSDSTWTQFGQFGATSATVTGLLAATSYDFRVTATNSAGSGSASSVLTVSTAAAGKLLTDVTAPVAGAYSTRLLRASYAGSAIQVRRSSDNTTQNIGFDGSGNLDTASLLTFAGSGDAFVTTWYDQSGSGLNITQATTTAQPKIVAAGAVVTISNSKAGVQFDGNTQVLFRTSGLGLWAAGSASECSVLKTTTDMTGLTSAKRAWAEALSTSGANQYGLMQPDKGSQFASPLATGMIGAAGTPANCLGSNAVFNAAVHQVSATDTGASMKQWVDTVVDLPATAYTRTAFTTPDRFAIGGVVRSGSLAALAHTLGELILWPSALSDADRTTAQTSQKTYFGTP